jgi:hypothetical protein
VCQAGSREGVVDLRRDGRADPEQDPRAERRLGLRHDAVQPVEQLVADSAEPRRGTVARTDDLGPVRAADAADALPGEVLAVREPVEVLGQLDPCRDTQPVAGLDRDPAWHPDEEPIREGHRPAVDLGGDVTEHDLQPVRPRTGVVHDRAEHDVVGAVDQRRDRWPVAGHGGARLAPRPDGTGDEDDAGQQERGAGSPPDSGREERERDAAADCGECRGCGRRAEIRHEDSGRDPADRGRQAEARERHASARRRQALDLLALATVDRASRDCVLERGEGPLLSRLDDPVDRDRTDPGQRLELLGARRVEVQGSARFLPSVRHGRGTAARARRGRRRLVTDARDDDLHPVLEPFGEVDARRSRVEIGVLGVASRGRQRVRDSRARRQLANAGRRDRALDVHHDRRRLGDCAFGGFSRGRGQEKRGLARRLGALFGLR